MNDHSSWGSPYSIVRLVSLPNKFLCLFTNLEVSQANGACLQSPAQICTVRHSADFIRWIPWTSFLWSHLGQTRNKLPLRNWLSWNVVNVSWVLICLVWTAATVVKCVLHGLILESIFFTHGDTCKSGILLCVANVQRFNSDEWWTAADGHPCQYH